MNLFKDLRIELSITDYLKESLTLMKEIVVELKKIRKELEQFNRMHYNWHVGDGK